MSEHKPVLESTLEGYLIKQCHNQNILIIKNTGMRGIPDRMLIKNGHHVFLELKRPGEKPRPLQIEIAKKLRMHGAVTFYADSKNEIDLICNLLNNDNQTDILDKMDENIRYFEK